MSHNAPFCNWNVHTCAHYCNKVWDMGLVHNDICATFMMTSSNGNIFRVTGHLYGEFAGDLWIPRTKASNAELWWVFICAWINGRVNNREAGDLRRHRAHYDATVMLLRVRTVQGEILHFNRSKSHNVGKIYLLDDVMTQTQFSNYRFFMRRI